MGTKNIIKSLRCAAPAIGAAVALTLPAAAHAEQWTPSQMLEKAGQNGSVKPTEVTTEKVSSWVNTFVSWAIGIIVALFVLRIALTAFDRMVVANMNTTFAMPGAYPNPGDERYEEADAHHQGRGNFTEGWTWKRIWLNFAKNLAICIGAWVLVQLVMGAILFFMSSNGMN